MSTKYWFYLESHIFVSYNDNDILLYDTTTGSYIERTSAVLADLLKSVYDERNLGVVELMDSDVISDEMASFFKDVISKKMGNLIEATNREKPIVLIPKLFLNHDMDKLYNHEILKKEEMDDLKMFLTSNASQYLLAANIHVNGDCKQNCRHCTLYDKQFTCCGKYEQTLSIDDLNKIASQLSHVGVPTINIIGGDIYSYKYLNNIFELFDHKSLNFYINYRNYIANEKIDNSKIHIVIDPDFDFDIVNMLICKTGNLEVEYHFIIENEKQYLTIIDLMSFHDKSKYHMHPFFNGDNIEFFKKNVFYSKNEILENKHSMRSIFRNQKMSATLFGNLYFYPDGNVKASPNSKIIGNIETQNLVDIIRNELFLNTAWRRIRNEGNCKTCLFQFLCPPISNYEEVFAKTNLCSEY